MKNGLSHPISTPDATAIGYTLIRHVGLILDELSSQGLDVWPDAERGWRWRARPSLMRW